MADKHICDCGTVYTSSALVIACADRNHGWPVQKAGPDWEAVGPDLLAALEELHSAMVWLIAQLPNDEGIADYNLDQAEAADIRARAAIAKAKEGMFTLT